MSVSTISPKQLFDLVQAGEPVELIDVRTPVEFREVHVAIARNIPLEQLDPQQLTVGRAGSQKPIYVICRSGSRGKQACEKIVGHGFANVVNVEGGTMAWNQAELPVVRVLRNLRSLVVGEVRASLANESGLHQSLNQLTDAARRQAA